MCVLLGLMAYCIINNLLTYVHVHGQYFQTSSPLNTAWPIKDKFCNELCLKEGTYEICKSILGHKTKMAAMPINGKNP